MERTEQKKLGGKKLLSLIIAVILLLTLAIIVWIQDQRATKRAVLLLEAADEVKGGNLKVLASEDGQVSTTLLEAAGDGPKKQQPQKVREALDELSEAILRKAGQLHNSPELTQIYQNRIRDLLIISDTRLAPDKEQWRSFEPHLENRLKLLTEWLQGSERSNEESLDIINRMIKTTQEIEDSVFARLLHESRLEIWSTLIAEKGDDASGRVIVIRKLIQSIRHERDAQLKLASLKFLAGHLTDSLTLKKDEAQIIDQSLTKLRPNLRGLMESGLRFEVVLSAMTSCESGDACKKFLDGLQMMLDNLRRMTTERQPGVESALKDLFSRLPPESKKEIWEMIFKHLEASYLFSQESTAWPQGLTPLPIRARRALSDNTARTSQLQDEFLDRLASRPVYESEALYLLLATEKKWAEHRLVENSHTSLAKIRARAWPPFTNFRIIRDQLLKNRPDQKYHWDSVPGSNQSLSNKADHLLGHLWSLPQSGWPYKQPSQNLVEELKATVRTHCRSLAATKPAVCAQYE